MFNKITAFAAFAVVAGLFIYFISGITRMDIIAANEYSHQIPAELVTAGDIVVVPRNGKISRICNAVVATDHLDRNQKSEFYFNRADRIVGWVAGIGEWVGLGKGKGHELVASRAKLSFIGRSTSLNGVEYAYLNPESCECDMVRELALGERVCAVSASLIETREVLFGENGGYTTRPVQRSLAVVLRRHVLALPEKAFEACGVDYTAAAKSVQQERCPSDGRTLPIDVRVRKFLNLIDSERL